MSEPAQRIAGLTPAQRELLLRRLSQKGGAPAAAIRRLGPEAAAPLSFAQERAFFHDRMASGPGARSITGALRLAGRLSIPALAAALAAVVSRHEPLRSSFAAPQGEPILTISEPPPPGSGMEIGLIDLSPLPPAEREAEARRRFVAETRRPFDLGGDLLLRPALIRLAAEEHLLLLSMHHSAADGWSIGVLVAELSVLYTAHVGSAAPPLPELPISYRDYAAWQRERIASGALAADLAYWRERLSGAPPVLRLRPDRDGPAAGAVCRGIVAPALRERLERLGRAEDATLFATVLAAFLALLMRCTGQQDLLIGSPVSGRTRRELEPLIGLFVNTVALRAELAPACTFREALATVRATVLGALAHHEAPFEQVVRQLAPERRSEGQPLFDILFNFTPSPPRALELPELTVRLEEAPEAFAELAMQLYVTEWEGALELRLVYAGGRYSEARMGCFLDQLSSVLEQAAADPGLPLAALDLTTPLARRLLPDPTAPLPEPLFPRVAASIAAWAARSPGLAALEQGGVATSYAELLAGMERVAERLAAAGLVPGDVVAVGGARGKAVVVAMAGVLLSGGVLLTLSRDLPERRRRVMLEEARARFAWLAGGGEDEAWLREVPGLKIVRAEIGEARGAAAPDLSPRPPSPRTERPAGREPAYVFFTSGSTGKPKGILGTQAGLAHFLDWQRGAFAVGPGDRCGQLTGLSFDVVLRDVFLPLTSGATLVFPAEEDLASGAATLRWLERERISLLHSVPAIAEMWLLEKPREVALATLRRVFFAGEPLTAELVARWRAAFPASGEIVNIYGPTETTLAKCFYRVPPRPLPGVQPVGAAIPQAQALVLTRERKPCGLGEPGEIAMRTPFRSLGYLNAAAENARRFVPNPFGGGPDDLLYLTGDRGAYRADGMLEYLGRLDDQVKIRGVRVEPMEVAAVLESCPEVAACAVIAREDGTGAMALVAYVVAERGAAEDAGRLLAFLRARLAGPMVPSAVVFLQRLPLNANHKVDRARLPAPETVRPRLEQARVAPRSATEAAMARIWEELLGLEEVGVTDGFFDLGGHSLLAMRMLSRVEQRLGKAIPLAALFEGPTIERLALLAAPADGEGGAGGETWPRVLTLATGPGLPKLFLAHPGGGVALAYAPLARHLAAEVAVFALQARGLDGRDAPHQDLAAMAADYVGEVRAIQAEGPYLLAGHSFGGVIAFEMARLLAGLGQEVALLALLDAAAPAAGEAEGRAADPADPDDEDARNLAALVRAAASFAGIEPGLGYDALRALPAEERIARAAAELGRDAGLFGRGGAPLVRRLLEVNRAHLRAKRAYRPALSPVPATLIRARDAAGGDDESLGWSRLCAERVEVLWTPGDHLTMITERHAAALAGLLRSRLARRG